MYFADLSPYSYGTFYGPNRIIPLPEVLTVGWLENGHNFPKGQVDKQTLLKLKRLLVNFPDASIRSKGYHGCDICPSSENTSSQPHVSFEGTILTLGSSELWLPSATSQGIFYAAPNLIYHYIIEHCYNPPIEFLNAVNHANIEPNWNAFEQMQSLLEKHRALIRLKENI